MPIYLLTPINLGGADWRYSTDRSPVQVEADNEQRARQRAALFLGMAMRVRAAEDAGANPWTQSTYAIARVVDRIDPALRLILAGDHPDRS
jgi:hypothetical protein